MAEVRLVSRRPLRRRALLLRSAPTVLAAALLLGGAVPYFSGAGRGYLSYLVLADRLDAQGAAAAQSAVRAVGGQVVQDYPQIGAVLAYANDGRFAARLRARPGIAAVGATRTATVPGPPGALAGSGDFRLPGADRFTGGGRAGEAFVTSGNAADGMEGDSTPTVPDPGEQAGWNLAMMGGLPTVQAPAALLAAPVSTATREAARQTALRQVLVAVLDSGVDDTHPDLRDAVSPGDSASCADGRPDARFGSWRPDSGVTESGHGTHVAGLIGAARDGHGVVGVAPGVRIAAVRLLGPLGQYYPENIVCGLLWAADRGAVAVNDSYFADPWKYNCPEDPDQRAMILAVGRAVAYAQRRALVVASAGNDGQDLAGTRVDQRSPNDRLSGPAQDRRLGTECVRLPGELPGVLSVSAVTRTGAIAGYSNYGDGRIALAAPGGDPDGGPDDAIVSDWPGGRYAALAGTSMSAAHVTGAIAVAAALHPGWGPDRLRELLLAQARANCPVGAGLCRDRRSYGAGIVALPH
ncbi:subtilisin family serine protease [Kitasatospora sp. GAS204A]|uniref:S8 family serine peptidase n=1 Tax=unclassified Kitasatospora TaxID=2633591 RepID=UPI00247643D1|nr:S8 family serine peptidase [Kitasatospora sp. GAS204B]MDH6121747.1 subtilisin family serine protease [Kitasatospora sp. GAS204B]